GKIPTPKDAGRRGSRRCRAPAPPRRLRAVAFSQARYARTRTSIARDEYRARGITPTRVLVGEFRIARPRSTSHRTFHRAAQCFPFRLRADRDRDPLVVTRARIGVVRRHLVVTISPLPSIAAVHREIHVPFRHLAD